jgi:hypothetical protein
MPNQLPQELLDKIAFYLPFEKGISISVYLEKMLGKAPTEHSWVVEEQGNILGICWLHYHGIYRNVEKAMDDAARKGQLEVVQWLHNEGCTVEVMKLAAENGHLEVVQWLHKNRSEGCTVNAMDWAARHGHLEVVQWLHENRSEGCTVGAMNWATENGHLEVVQWLHDTLHL